MRSAGFRSDDTEISGFIPQPMTGFQAKADDMRAGKIAKEMRLPNTKRGKGAKALLRPSICDLASAGGAYVIVSSKGSTADSRLIERREAMRNAIADLDGGDALHLDFYDRTRMADWVGDYPGEALWVRERIGQPLSGWRPFGNWSQAPDHQAVRQVARETDDSLQREISFRRSHEVNRDERFE